MRAAPGDSARPLELLDRVPGPTGVECAGWEGPCDSLNATRQRQNTQYVEDAWNWVTLCPECMKANSEHWNERWREYNSERL